jgi:hypothetical protein
MKKIFFYFFIVFFISCSIFKKTQKITKISVVDSVYTNQLKYNTLSYKLNAEYKSNDNNLSFFGTISIIKDSLILASVSPGFGITLADIIITPDTIISFFPLENSYTSGGSTFFIDKFNIALDFYSLQNILSTCLFTYPFFEKIENYTITNDSILKLSNILYNKKNNKFIDVQHTFIFNNNYKITNSIIEDNVLNVILLLNYSNYSKVENIYFPSDIKVNLYSNDTINLNLKLKNIQLNKPIINKFKLPKNAKVSDF